MPTRILGIDPGSRKTGFGIIEVDGKHVSYVVSGCLKVGSYGPGLPPRLKAIFEGVSEIVTQYGPTEMAVEQVFMRDNVDSALKLGQARGAAICGGVVHDLPVAEYTATQIKQAVVGRGHASKDQIQFMVRALLNLPGTPQEDAADALACALCHHHIGQTLTQIKNTAT